MRNNFRIVISISIIIVISGFVFVILQTSNGAPAFSSQQAYAYVEYQLGLGPRVMRSEAHDLAAQWIISTLKKWNWQVETQEAVVGGQNVKNIIAKRGTGSPWIILASHYDSRSTADRDPDLSKRNQPVPGADDGASTVAILLELAQAIPQNENKQIWLVFFDNEDNGNSSGEGWGIGSQYFVSQLEGIPDGVVILDMLGDKNLNIYMEQQSNRELNAEIWGTAKELGYSQFTPTYKNTIIDDHVPFIEAGIKAIDVIDIDYAYWHTTQDTIDKISPDSLQVVGDTMLKWLEEYPK